DFVITRIRPPSHSSFFPYTTLFRSLIHRVWRTSDWHRTSDLPMSPRPGGPAALTKAKASTGRRGICFLTHTSAMRSAIAMAEVRSEEHTSELQSRRDLVCRLLREKT